MANTVHPDQTVSSDTDLANLCLDMASKAKQASREMASLSGTQIDDWLLDSAKMLIRESKTIIDANHQDVARKEEFGLSDAQVDRLRLDESRIAGIAQALGEIAALESPVGEIFDSKRRPNGLQVNKVRVPLGVIFFVYESRPNVTADAAAISVKSRNAVILRGGKEAFHSSRAIVKLLNKCASKNGIPEYAVQLVQTPDRAAVDYFLKLNQQIDLTIPRGGQSLIRRVVDKATMPVMKHFSGNCHVYVDAQANLKMAAEIVINSKCQRVGVCNAAESLLVHDEIAEEFLPAILSQLYEQGVEVRGDEKVCMLCSEATLATKEDYAAEFLDKIISIKTVSNVQAAIEHINCYGSGHTDVIVSDHVAAIDQFTNQVDTAVVMVNASSRFNDGGEFGLGAEIGISTDKFHARGPCGLKELTTYKYICTGNGQIRGG